MILTLRWNMLYIHVTFAWFKVSGSVDMHGNPKTSRWMLEIRLSGGGSLRSSSPGWRSEWFRSKVFSPRRKRREASTAVPPPAKVSLHFGARVLLYKTVCQVLVMSRMIATCLQWLYKHWILLLLTSWGSGLLKTT